MKKLFMMLFTAALAATTIGCSEDSTTDLPYNPGYEIKDADLEVSVIGGRGTIEIEASKTARIDAQSSADWLRITKITPSAIGYEADKNNDGTRREAQITVTVDGLSCTVKVVQFGMEIEIIEITDTFEARGGNGKLVMDVLAAGEVELLSSADWLTLGERVDNKERITLNYEAASYAQSTNRVALLEVRSGQMSEKLEITQNGAWIRVSNREIDLNPNGEAVTVTVETNMAEEPVITVPEEAKEWMKVDIQQGQITLDPEVNYYTSRETLINITGGELDPLRLIVKQTVIDLFDVLHINAGHEATDEVITLHTTEYMAGATSSWSAVPAEGCDWIRLNATGNSLRVGVDKFDNTTESRRGEINILNSEGEILRVIPIYQMNMLSLRGYWSLIDKSGKTIANINLRRDERIIRKDYKSSVYAKESDFHHLEIHDLKFTNYGNQQPWLNIYSASGKAALEFRMPMGCGWGNFRTIIAAADFVSNSEFTYWEEYQLDENGNPLTYVTEEGSTAKTPALGWLLTYDIENLEDGTTQEVLRFSQNDAMRAHKDSERMNGFMYVAHREVDGQIQVTSWGGYPNVAKLVRTEHLTEADLANTSTDPNVAW